MVASQGIALGHIPRGGTRSSRSRGRWAGAGGRPAGRDRRLSRTSVGHAGVRPGSGVRGRSRRSYPPGRASRSAAWSWPRPRSAGTSAQTEREALVAFAEHASLAVTDAARTRQMVHSALHDALTGLPNRAAVQRSARPAPGAPARAHVRPPRCSSSTSTTSSASTTRWATPPATRSWSSRHDGCAARARPRTPSPGSAATSSRCCSTPSTDEARRSAAAERLLERRSPAARCRWPGSCRLRASIGVAWLGPASTARLMCCAAPTWRCTRPRRAAVVRSRSSDPSWTSARCVGSSSRATCARDRRAASSASLYQPIVGLPSGRDRRGRGAGALGPRPGGSSPRPSSSRWPRRPG